MLAKDEREAAARGEGCLGRAAEDLFAPLLIEHWANTVHKQGGTAADRKVMEAMELSEQMRAWQRRTGRAKIPD